MNDALSEKGKLGQRAMSRARHRAALDGAVVVPAHWQPPRCDPATPPPPHALLDAAGRLYSPSFELLPGPAPLVDVLPVPDSFADRAAYAEAVAEWAQRTHAALAGVTLPLPVSRVLCRPSTARAADDAVLWDDTDDSAFDDSHLSPRSDGSRGLGGDEMRARQQWRATLVPPAPTEPEALRRWCWVVRGGRGKEV